MNLGLERITALLNILDNPQNKYPVIHVAGTNGKGSICAYLDSIFTAATYKTGRFNSPHFLIPRDSICIAGKVIEKSCYDSVRAHVESLNQFHSIHASSFELMTACAFLLFFQEKVDVAIIEVGIGGLHDATNVCHLPSVSIISAIGMDHIGILGQTISDITRHKAGILRPHGIGVVAPQSHREVLQVIDLEAQRISCRIHKVEKGVVRVLHESKTDTEERWVIGSYLNENIEFPLPLLGDFQLDNVTTALAALEIFLSKHSNFNITKEHVRQGISNVKWPGRLEWIYVPMLSRHVLVDGAHNLLAAQCVNSFINKTEYRKQGKNSLTWILGFTDNKDYTSILRELIQPQDRVYGVGFSTPEGMPWISHRDPKEIITKTHELIPLDSSQVQSFHRISDVLNYIKDKEDSNTTEKDFIVVSGSLYLIADLYRTISDFSPLE